MSDRSALSVFAYAFDHNGVPGTLWCQSRNSLVYTRLWLEESLQSRLSRPSDPLLSPLASALTEDLKFDVAIDLGAITFPPEKPLRATISWPGLGKVGGPPIGGCMRNYLRDQGIDYIEMMIFDIDDRLEIYKNSQALGLSPTSWCCYHMRGVTDPALWHTGVMYMMHISEYSMGPCFPRYTIKKYDYFEWLRHGNETGDWLSASDVERGVELPSTRKRKKWARDYDRGK